MTVGRPKKNMNFYVEVAGIRKPNAVISNLFDRGQLVPKQLKESYGATTQYLAKSNDFNQMRASIREEKTPVVLHIMVNGHGAGKIPEMPCNMDNKLHSVIDGLSLLNGEEKMITLEGCVKKHNLTNIIQAIFDGLKGEGVSLEFEIFSCQAGAMGLNDDLHTSEVFGNDPNVICWFPSSREAAIATNVALQNMKEKLSLRTSENYTRDKEISMQALSGVDLFLLHNKKVYYFPISDFGNFSAEEIKKSYMRRVNALRKIFSVQKTSNIPLSPEKMMTIIYDRCRHLIVRGSHLELNTVLESAENIQKGGKLKVINGTLYSSPLLYQLAALSDGEDVEKKFHTLLEHGADVNGLFNASYNSDKFQGKENKYSILSYACEGKRLNFVKLLLHNGADIYQLFGNKDTCLMLASVEGADEIIKILIAKHKENLRSNPTSLAKASKQSIDFLNMRNEFETTALHFANTPETIRLFLGENNIEVNPRDTKKYTPFLYCRGREQMTECLEAFLEHEELEVGAVGDLGNIFHHVLNDSKANHSDKSNTVEFLLNHPRMSSFIKQLINMPNICGLTPLHYAIRDGNYDVVYDLFHRGECDREYKFKKFSYKLIPPPKDSSNVQNAPMNPLKRSIRDRNTAQFKEELDKTTDFFQTDEQGNTLLHRIILSHDLEILKIFLENPQVKAKLQEILRSRNNEGKMALHLAVDQKLFFLADMIYVDNIGVTREEMDFSEYTQDVLKTLKEKIEMGGQKTKSLQSLVKNITEIDEYIFSQHKENPRNILLLDNIKNGKLEAVKKWIKEGHSINEPLTKRGSTALMLAIDGDQTDLAKWILNYPNFIPPLQINTRISIPRSALSFAAAEGNLELVKLLLAKGALIFEEPKGKDECKGPLYEAIYYNHIPIVQELIKHQAINFFGEIDYLEAAAYADEEMVEFILSQKGATNADTSKSIVKAVFFRDLESLKILIEKGKTAVDPVEESVEESAEKKITYRKPMTYIAMDNYYPLNDDHYDEGEENHCVQIFDYLLSKDYDVNAVMQRITQSTNKDSQLTTEKMPILHKAAIIANKYDSNCFNLKENFFLKLLSYKNTDLLIKDHNGQTVIDVAMKMEPPNAKIVELVLIAMKGRGIPFRHIPNTTLKYAYDHQNALKHIRELLEAYKTSSVTFSPK